MKKPKMIIFDYGFTLLYEPNFNTLQGEKALFKYIKSNKNDLTPEQVNDFAQELFYKISNIRQLGMEFHQKQFMKLLYEYLEIEFSISIEEIEKIFWDNTSFGAKMPNVDALLNYIHENGIRCGVISNIGWSGNALQERINRLLPGNHFEFIITSSEYIFRKPNRILFELALKKAGLKANEVWFCGDNIAADIEGASAVGMLPVWYTNNTIDSFDKVNNNDEIPKCKHIHIDDWLELIVLLEKNIY